MIKKFGGDEENRTPDPLLARQVLSQLSYAPIMVSRDYSLKTRQYRTSCLDLKSQMLPHLRFSLERR